MIGFLRVTWSSRGLRHEITPAHQVVGRGAEGKDPVDEAAAAVAKFPKQPDGLHPAEGLLDQLPLALTEPIPDVSGGAAIDRAAAVPNLFCATCGVIASGGPRRPRRGCQTACRRPR